MSEINFFSEDISFELENKAPVQRWLEDIASSHNRVIDTLNYIFCSDDYLLSVNIDYLGHDYYTDIITFDNSEAEAAILSDIFISIERVHENADQQSIPFTNELHRVMAHGLLHLVGYKDKTEDEKILMRQNEDACLSLLQI